MTRLARTWSLLASAALVLAGCASKAPPAPPLLDLGALIENGQPPSATRGMPADPAVWQLVSPLRVPAAAEREVVLVSDGQGQVRPWQGRRWTEPPRDTLQRLLLADLARLRGADRVWGGSPPPGVRVQLRVEVLSWEAVESAGEVRLTARWSLTSPVGSTAPLVQQRSFASPWRPAGADALLRAQRDVVARLAQAIATGG